LIPEFLFSVVLAANELDLEESKKLADESFFFFFDIFLSLARLF